MPVIDEGGVVGQIVRVTPMTAEAALVADEQVSIPVQLLRNGLRLIAFGGNSPGKMERRRRFVPCRPACGQSDLGRTRHRFRFRARRV
ncbi:hypothetical protein G6F31_021631 [Rhizopus arrhizus]|nr:hypothetical protein G6F31_021631 [Rhizopus arrhizus]